MALVFADSFDHYAFADRALKWSLQSSQSASFAVNGRWGTTAFNIAHGNDWLLKRLPPLATYVTGCAVHCAAWSTNHRIFTLEDSVSGVVHLYLSFDGAGKLVLYHGNGAVLGTAAAALTASAFVYIELKATIHDSAGAAEVRVNEATVIGPLTGIDTRNGGLAVIDTIRYGRNANVALGTQRVDDLYICDTTTVDAAMPNNDFLGDIRVESRLPSGNGTTSQLVGSDGNSTDNYLLVDEATPASADYVESSTVGQKDTYAYQDITPTTGTVRGVQILPFAAKSDAGVRSIATVARSGGTEADSASKTLSATYTYLPDIRGVKPDGAAWSISDVNAAEFGAKVTA